jgi:hypothetical protein
VTGNLGRVRPSKTTLLLRCGKGAAPVDDPKKCIAARLSFGYDQQWDFSVKGDVD